MGTQNLWVLKIKFCGYSNLWVFKNQGYSKFIDTQNLQVLYFMGTQNLWVLKRNRAYPENTNFETFVPRNLKFQTFGDLHTTKKC